MRPGDDILVLGAAGMLGRALGRELTARGFRPVAWTRDEFDLARTEELPKGLAVSAPAAVINAAAFTDVNRAEDPSARDEVYRINRDLPEALGEWCAARGRPLVHVSTDYVFDGRKREPYVEEDPTGPLQVYGRSKLEGEQRLRAVMPGAIIARTSTLFGPGRRERPHYVDAILEQARVADRVEVVELPRASPTLTVDLAAALVELLTRRAAGLYHTVNSGECSRRELAAAAIEAAGLAGRVRVGTRPDPGGSPARPGYSALAVGKLEAALSRPMPTWQDAVRRYVRGLSG